MMLPFSSVPQATRAIFELLQEPSRRMELHTFFSSLFVRLLFRVSFLVLEGSAEMTQDHQSAVECVDPVKYVGLWASVGGLAPPPDLRPARHNTPSVSSWTF